MIQYSSINDAWGNKEIYKKNMLNNIDGFNNSKSVEKGVSPKVAQETQDIQETKVTQEYQVPQNIVPQNNVPQNNVPQNIVPQNIEPSNKEHFEPMPINNKNSCNIAEHLKNCEHCRNSLTEYFENDNSISQINILGLKINITKDVLRIIFVILIVLIFIIILSTINISLNDTRMNMKYYMIPQIPHNLPYYH